MTNGNPSVASTASRLEFAPLMTSLHPTERVFSGNVIAGCRVPLLAGPAVFEAQFVLSMSKGSIPAWAGIRKMQPRNDTRASLKNECHSACLERIGLIRSSCYLALYILRSQAVA
jgi:hypothetical protein